MKIERFSSVVAALILLQTLYFKFTAAPESVFIFSELGIEPYGRIGTGALEFLVSIFLLFRRFSLLGAIAGVIVILGALMAHIFVLGIQVQNDGGKLFLLALIVLFLCLISIFLQKQKLIQFLQTRTGSRFSKL